MPDTSELICFNTKYVAGCPDPVHEVEASELLEPEEHFFVPVARALEPHILEFGSGSDLFVGRRDWNVRFVDIFEHPIVPPVERDVGTI